MKILSIFLLRDRSNKNELLPCSALLEVEYGLRDIFLGVLVRLGIGGINEIVEMNLNESEVDALTGSAQTVRNLIEKINL